MILKLLTPPAEEPVALDEARLFLRISEDQIEEDAMIEAMITAARVHAETVTHRAFVTQTWKCILDAFPGPSMMGIPPGVGFSLPGHAIYLNKTPVSSVTSIRYLDMAGVWQTMPSTDYVVDLACEPARITPVFGKIWPIPMPQIGSVEVTFVAGYGSEDDVPQGIKNWIKVRVNSLYANREEAQISSHGKIESVGFLDGLLDPYTVHF